MIHTGGRFDPDDGPVYFIAANADRLRNGCGVHPWVLVALNEIQPKGGVKELEEWIDDDIHVLIDSGIFWLATTHAGNHGLTMDEALSLPPQEIDGFDLLWDRFQDVIRRIGDKAWGYIELDQGGRENKIKTRATLEELGFKPIPVYHPINDGWDYFDELAQRYDRICMGNIVQADPDTRRKLLTTLWERRRKYPDLWVHLLGYTPNQWMNCLAGPRTSADSSVWLASVKYPTGISERAMLKPVGNLGQEFNYAIGTERADPVRGSGKATAMSALSCGMHQRNWRQVIKRWDNLGRPIGAPDGR